MKKSRPTPNTRIELSAISGKKKNIVAITAIALSATLLLAGCSVPADSHAISSVSHSVMLGDDHGIDALRFDVAATGRTVRVTGTAALITVSAWAEDTQQNEFVSVSDIDGGWEFKMRNSSLTRVAYTVVRTDGTTATVIEDYQITENSAGAFEVSND